ncbi:hypothetical protein RJ46_17225 [Vibrio sinaloensis]|nr:hypothetical protein RJ46_17225 [Vibrio sinaloensis]
MTFIALIGCNESEEVTREASKKHDLKVIITGITEEGGNFYTGCVINTASALISSLHGKRVSTASTIRKIKQNWRITLVVTAP